MNNDVNNNDVNNDVILEVKHLHKTFKRKGGGLLKAVDDVSFVCRQGQTMGLVGSSGCGKSTLANIIMGLVPQDEGEVLWQGKVINYQNKLERQMLYQNMQIIFQDSSSTLNPARKIGSLLDEALLVGAKIKDQKQRLERIDYILSKVGLSSRVLNSYPNQLSGGQRQRVNIALSIVVNPRFIICDEPVSALDLSVQAQVLNLLKDLQAEFNLSYLFISHDLNVVGYFCDQVAIMSKGQIIESGDLATVWQQPQSDFTRELLKNQEF